MSGFVDHVKFEAQIIHFFTLKANADMLKVFLPFEGAFGSELCKPSGEYSDEAYEKKFGVKLNKTYAFNDEQSKRWEAFEKRTKADRLTGRAFAGIMVSAQVKLREKFGYQEES